MERLHGHIADYQKRISSYDKQLWERSVEQKLLKTLAEAPRQLIGGDSYKRGLIDIDLIRGSTFPKAKPEYTLTAIAWKSFKHTLFLPAYFRWWREQVGLWGYVGLMMLYLAQVISLVIYFCDTGEYISPETVCMTEVVSPLFICLILGNIHTHIVSARTHWPTHRDKRSGVRSPSAKRSEGRPARSRSPPTVSVSSPAPLNTDPAKGGSSIPCVLPGGSSIPADCDSSSDRDSVASAKRRNSDSGVEDGHVTTPGHSQAETSLPVLPPRDEHVTSGGADGHERSVAGKSSVAAAADEGKQKVTAEDKERVAAEDEKKTIADVSSRKASGASRPTSLSTIAETSGLRRRHVTLDTTAAGSEAFPEKGMTRGGSEDSGEDGRDLGEKGVSSEDLRVKASLAEALIEAAKSDESLTSGRVARPQKVTGSLGGALKDGEVRDEAEAGAGFVYLDEGGEVSCNTQEDVTSLDGPLRDVVGEILVNRPQDEVSDNNLPASSDGELLTPDDVLAAQPSAFLAPDVEADEHQMNYIPDAHDAKRGHINLMGLQTRLNRATRKLGAKRSSKTTDLDASTEDIELLRHLEKEKEGRTEDSEPHHTSDTDGPARTGASYLPAGSDTGTRASILKHRLEKVPRRRRRSTSRLEGQSSSLADSRLANRCYSLPGEAQRPHFPSDSLESEDEQTAVTPHSGRGPQLKPKALLGVCRHHNETEVSEMEWEDHMQTDMNTSDSSSCESGADESRSRRRHPSCPDDDHFPWASQMAGTAGNSHVDKVTCVIWEGGVMKKVHLSPFDIGWAIIQRADAVPERSDYVGVGMLFTLMIAVLPTCFRLLMLEQKTDFDYYSLPGLANVGYNLAGNSFRTSYVILCALSVRVALASTLFFLLCVAERTFKQRLLYAKHFCYLTSSRRARKYDTPHFRLNKVGNIRAWLSLRSYLKKRGPQRSVDVIVSAVFLLCVTLMSIMSLHVLQDSGQFLDQLYNWEVAVWCLALGVFLLRYLSLGVKVNKKYRNLSILLTEQINLYLQMEQKPHKKEELLVANAVLKLAEDLLKEIESPFKISGLQANPFLMNILKVVILSAFSAVATDVVGFKLKLYKIKLKA